jgi:hypothetical protein
MTPNAPARRFQIKAIVDDVSSCECCGRTGLQRTVAIEDCETGEVRYFGTSCAMQPAKGFKLEKVEMAKSLRDLEAKQAAAKRQVQAEVAKVRQAWIKAEYIKRGGEFYEKENPLPGAQEGFKVWTLPSDPALMEACRVEGVALYPLG